MNRKLGPNLRQLMKLARLSQADVGGVVGLSQPMIGKWIRGVNTPDVYQAYALAQLFEVSVEQLLEADPAEIRPGRLKILA